MRQYRFDVHGKTTLRLFGSDAKLTGQRELSAKQVDQLVDEVEAGYGLSSRDLPKLGRRLYAWLDGPAERWLAKARQGTPGLAIHVDVEERLRHLPWELLCEDKVFLCGQADYPFTPVRRVHDVQRKNVKEQNRPLQMLFMACSAEGDEPVLHFEDEEQRIVEATEKQPIELVVEELGSLTGLAERTESFGRGYFDVLHLTGHADVVNDVPCFVMEDDYGGPTAVTAQQIAEAMGGLWPRLVFLSGCKTGQAVDAGLLPSMCEAIVRAGAPAVLGWALPVSDAAATALWSESLKLTEQIGDAGGKAATLANMAWAAGRKGDVARERALNLEAARALADARVWVDLVTVLGNLGVSEEPDAAGDLAQALWLTLRVQVPLPDVVNTAAALAHRLGEKDSASPLVATYAHFAVETRGKDHPEYEKLRQRSGGMLSACAAARGIERTAEKFAEWFKSEGLGDPKQFLPALEKALEQIVGDKWVFDRSVFEEGR